MSRIGKLPIPIPNSVEVVIENNLIKITGNRGTLSYMFRPEVEIKKENTQLIVEKKNDTRMGRSVFGLTRALVNNMVVGVTDGFERQIEIIGIGYNAKLVKNALLFALGYSHHIYFALPAGISAEVPEPTKIIIRGIDKHMVGQVAANIRQLRPPEPYKGKGIRYKNENVRRKAGKTAGK